MLRRLLPALGLLLGATPLAAQEPLTLTRAIEIAQSRSFDARAAEAACRIHGPPVGSTPGGIVTRAGWLCRP